MSKSKLFAGRILLIHAVITFFSFLILWAKHKSLAKAFLALSAGSAVAGGLLIHAHRKEEDADLEALFDDADDLDAAGIDTDDAQDASQGQADIANK